MRHTGTMSHDVPPLPSTLPQAAPVAGKGPVRRAQFSLSALLLAMLLFGIGCAVIRALGFVWIVPCSLAGLSIAQLRWAFRRRSSWRLLTVGPWHFAIWLALAAVSSACTVQGCLDYNAVAGTDKTQRHIVRISAAVLAGPMVGPVANPAAGEIPQAKMMTTILFAILFLSVCPFLFARRMAPPVVALVCWTLFLAASILWFFGAMISLGVFLS